MNRGNGRGRNQSPRSFYRPRGGSSPSTHITKPTQDGKDDKSKSGGSSTDRSPMQSDEAVLLGSTSLSFESLELVTNQHTEDLNCSKHLDGQPGSKFTNDDQSSTHPDYMRNNPILRESELLQPPNTVAAAISPKEETKCRESSEEKTAGVGRLKEPFDICRVKAGILKLKSPLLVRNREKKKEEKRAMGEQDLSILRPGMVLLRNFISCGDQVKIVQTCRKLGLGKGGFYEPVYDNGARMRLNMMCLGLDWDPNTSSYENRRAVDGAEPPPVPSEFHQLVQKAIQEAHAYISKKKKQNSVESLLPTMTPDICIVNFYTSSGMLGLHQDKDESPESLKRGLPVVSISIGDSAEFLYGDERDEDKAEKVILESGDVLIFGGSSRHVYHGVKSILPKTAPPALLQDSDIRPGRLNLTFRKN